MEAPKVTGAKFIANRGELLAALTGAASIIHSRTPKPILTCVKIATGGDLITVEASNLEQSIRMELRQVHVESAGAFCVGAKDLIDILNASSGDTVTIGAEGEKVRIIGSSGSHLRPSMPAPDFPVTTGEARDLMVSIDGGEFLAMAAEADQAADEASPFKGFFIDANGSTLTILSTDGRRMVRTFARVKNIKGRVVIPSRAMEAIKGLSPTGQIEIRTGDSGVSFSGDGFEIRSNQLEGSFPSYEDVIPKQHDMLATCDRVGLLSAVREAALATTEDRKGIRLLWSKAFGLKMDSQSEEKGDSGVNFPCKYEGADLEIGVNYRFLSDALKAGAEDEVRIGMTEPSRPILVMCGEGYSVTIMPSNLK